MKVSKETVDLDRKYHFKKEDNVEFGFGGIRDLNKEHVRRIKNDLKSGNAAFISAIEVNVNNMQIIDGCHRYQAYKDAWSEGFDGVLDVEFFDVPVNEQRNIVVNKNTTPKCWTKSNFVKMYLDEENPSVTRLSNFCKEHKLAGKKVTDRYGMAFLKGANVTNELLKTLSPSVEITEDDVEFANEIHPEVVKIYSMCGYTSTGGYLESLIQGWYQFRSEARNLRKIDKIGGIDKYFERLEILINDGTFNREQNQSKPVWYSRFVSVLETDATYFTKK